LKTFPLDPRPAALLERYHRRTRKRAPWLQAVLFSALAPVVLLLSRVRFHGREHIPEGGFIRAPNHPSQLDAFFAARRAGATVLPCHLSGTRGLYRPWTWPRITVTYGPALVFEPDPDPTRDANAQAAEQIADAVKALAP
jgi:1-acyl-sn-glycerol-3-phosphate acyltransferase